jgi:hydroxymethylglutaryl-CoA lyase
MSNYPEKVTLVEVGPRDGLQNEKKIVSTGDKIRFIDLLSESGLPVIEVGSFVHPKWVPQLADSAEVYQKIKKHKGTAYPLLVPNLKGLERALKVGAKEIALFTAASETFNKKNINMSIAESLNQIDEIAQEAKKAKMWVRGYVSTCFVCPYEGKIRPDQVLPIVDALLNAGVDEISIGDTIGAAVPADVENLFENLFPETPKEKIAVHFHDTHKTALANIVKSLELGISIVDSSAGGLGGCPYAPGASGNVSTEEVLYLLDGMKIDTGVDVKKVAEASLFIRAAL